MEPLFAATNCLWWSTDYEANYAVTEHGIRILCTPYRELDTCDGTVLCLCCFFFFVLLYPTWAFNYMYRRRNINHRRYDTPMHNDPLDSRMTEVNEDSPARRALRIPYPVKNLHSEATSLLEAQRIPSGWSKLTQVEESNSYRSTPQQNQPAFLLFRMIQASQAIRQSDNGGNFTIHCVNGCFCRGTDSLVCCWEITIVQDAPYVGNETCGA